jgi:hypothetical protein
MSFYAVEEIDDALERTKEILLPFELSNWTRLAIITLFLGGTGFANIFFQAPTSVPSGSYESTEIHMTEIAGAMAPASTATIAAAAALIFGAITIFIYLSSVFNFVMFRSLRDREVSIRKNLGRHYFDGFKYLLFQLGVLVVALGGFLGWMASFMLSPVLGLLLIFLVVPIFVSLAVLTGVVHDFALQEMIETDKGFIQAVKDSIREVTADWREFGAYLIFRLVVSWAVGIMSFFVVIGATMALAVPFLILGFLAAMLTPILGWIVGGIGLLAWIIAMLYINVPFKTYLYSYFVELYDAFMQ